MIAQQAVGCPFVPGRQSGVPLRAKKSHDAAAALLCDRIQDVGHVVRGIENIIPALELNSSQIHGDF